jgi:2-amino-4-hydroxy-6-hydroxymethyldihydropteridine diphosphokinase
MAEDKVKVFLSLGSNLGDKEKNLKDANLILEQNGIFIEKASKLYITKPFGYLEQDDFLNECLLCYTDKTPHDILKIIQIVEKTLKRKRIIRWGPRTIDVDILFYGDRVIKTDDLEIPHPGIPQRDFVLRPLMDLDPDFVHPLLKKSIKELYSLIEDKCEVYK